MPVSEMQDQRVQFSWYRCRDLGLTQKKLIAIAEDDKTRCGEILRSNDDADYRQERTLAARIHVLFAAHA